MRFGLITGGTRGIGLATARMLLELGYSVILVYANDDGNANTVLNTLREKYPDRIYILKEDLSDAANVPSLRDGILKITPILDILVLNAGLTNRSGFESLTFRDWDRVMQANVTVPFFIIQSLLPLMKTGASIVLMGSLMGIYSHSLSVVYGVSKAAVHSLVKNMVKFLAPYQLRINALAPGFVDTEWQRSKPLDIKEKITKKIALGRFALPEEIANAVWFLISNKYMNGETITIDGGYCFE